MPTPTPGSVVPLRRALAAGYLAALVALPVALGVGWLAERGDGVWGALIGLAIPVGFLSITTVVGLATARMAPTTMGAVVLGSWLVKIILLIAVLAVVQDRDFYARGVFFGVFVVALVGYLVIEWVVVLRTRAPYIEPHQDADGPAAGRPAGAPPAPGSRS